MNIYDMTEAHEASQWDVEIARQNYEEKRAQVARGEETCGVLAIYERAYLDLLHASGQTDAF